MCKGQAMGRGEATCDRGDEMTRIDYEAFQALLTRHAELREQLEDVELKLSALAGKARDHAAGFEHKAESCASCALSTPNK